MTHPEELLAGYVDGTLTDPERAVVDAHLPTCERCRESAKFSWPTRPSWQTWPRRKKQTFFIVW